ncbi:DUF2628 domain-containing protein [Lentibacillus sp. L22]|uniref:DUF2628 domain-containing protein n=1 Tax=Lentibacillus TaxID=175304 RepID=UPI0022B1ECC0|nr:DUF2628 domain-containing protein [Lentibacillus daqui]
MYCTNCGTELDRDANFCANCGQKKQDSLAATVTPADAAQDSTENNDSQLWKVDVQNFVGSNYPFYSGKWKQMQDKGNSFSRNFAAFFLSIFWLGYRKMYREIFVIALIFLAIDFILYLAGYEYTTETTGLFYDPVDYKINLAVMVILGLYGNHLYRKHTMKQISIIRDKEQPSEIKQAALKQKGGTSFLGVLLAIMIMILVYGVPTSFIPQQVDIVSSIQHGTFDELPDKTVDELFADLFEHGSWEEVADDSDTAVVRYNGEKQMDNERHEIQIDFAAEKDDKAFRIERVIVDNEELSLLETNDFLDYILRNGLNGEYVPEQDEPGYVL